MLLSPVAASEGFKFPACNFIKKETLEKYFSVPACVYLWILRCFSDHFFYRAPQGNFYLCKSCKISTTSYSKNYFTGAFKAFYTRSRSSHLKALIYLKSLKTVCQEVNLLWSCKMTTCKFMKKLSYILVRAFCLHFLRIHYNYFFQKGFESVQVQFLPGNISRK